MCDHSFANCQTMCHLYHPSKQPPIHHLLTLNTLKNKHRLPHRDTVKVTHHAGQSQNTLENLKPIGMVRVFLAKLDEKPRRHHQGLLHSGQTYSKNSHFWSNDGSLRSHKIVIECNLLYSLVTSEPLIFCI